MHLFYVIMRMMRKYMEKICIVILPHSFLKYPSYLGNSENLKPLLDFPQKTFTVSIVL